MPAAESHSKAMKTLIAVAKPVLTLLIRLIGMQVRDARTGKDVGKYLFIP